MTEASAISLLLSCGVVWPQLALKRCNPTSFSTNFNGFGLCLTHRMKLGRLISLVVVRLEIVRLIGPLFLLAFGHAISSLHDGRGIDSDAQFRRASWRRLDSCLTMTFRQSTRDDLRELRRSLLTIDRDDGVASAACLRVGDRLRPVMVRTERLASTQTEIMLKPINVNVALERPDIDGYLAAWECRRSARQRDVVQILEVRPVSLELHGHYQLKEEFDGAAERGGAPLNWSILSRVDEGC